MSEYIEREVAMKVIATVSSYLNPHCLEEQRKKIKAIPTADVAEVKHGEWIPVKKENIWGDITSVFMCSECQKFKFRSRGIVEKFTYCPNCGARMDKE